MPFVRARVFERSRKKEIVERIDLQWLSLTCITIDDDIDRDFRKIFKGFCNKRLK